MPSRFAIRVIEPKSAQKKPVEGGTSCKLLDVKDPGKREIWSVGDRYIHKNRGYIPGSELEAANVQIVNTRTSIPCPRILASWREGDRFLSIEERVEGESLEDIFFNVTGADIARIGQQLGRHLTQLRGVTAPTMAMLDGRPVVDFRLFKPLANKAAAPPQGYEVCRTDDDVRRQLSYAITGSLGGGAQLEAFMARMPSAQPFTFSHADVHEGNIMVDADGNFAALIDWELAGFYPVWWDFVNGNAALCDAFPPQLKYADALDWFTVYQAVREDPAARKTAEMLNSYMGWS
ncbi:kinase-like domain-containing protein [Biscogniauxia sp. FL1348]|nr:kinase-like domain-containing protein [Biscogniauxia sp. FL1348]